MIAEFLLVFVINYNDIEIVRETKNLQECQKLLGSWEFMMPAPKAGYHFECREVIHNDDYKEEKLPWWDADHDKSVIRDKKYV